MKKILIVDDDKDMNFMMKKVLSGHHYEVVTAVNGLEAVEKTKGNRIDLILMDVRMPYFSGFWFCDVFKKKPDTRDIPVVFVSALSDEENVQRAMTMGAKAYLKKPFNLDELLKVVESAFV